MTKDTQELDNIFGEEDRNSTNDDGSYFENTKVVECRTWEVKVRENSGFGRKLLHPYGFFSYMNVVFSLTALGFLIFNFYQIIGDYAHSLNNPSFATSFVDAEVSTNPRFPAMLLCNSQPNSPLNFRVCLFTEEFSGCDSNAEFPEGLSSNKTLKYANLP
eukprot:Awhi_evm1s8845